ncbi:DNA polymerase III subunit delta [Picosynechococcus sp. PCC 11901]|uniref:DNA polymerase III subunit delta n=1 Tax=Picosynechococcus sp. PCC 11901 TaxID=2579791 RepID=UPI0010FBE2BD|nr:DNA polymerase III subunit delta [Picosynechococcus sp. PCC 11901]QCS50115.1 DNA polymerase III subunit delta [Picosynechococcus sp. PCC 11901]
MAVYFFWGEDDFAIAQAVDQIKQSVLDPAWLSFNFQTYDGSKEESIIDALNEVMTPPFGMGGRLVWLNEATLCQSCSDSLLQELHRTLPVVPDSSHLLITSRKKPDKRLKSTKFIQEHAKVREFSPIPPWQTEALADRVRNTARELGVNLDRPATELLGEAVGNDTRRLWNELEKLKIYQGSRTQPLTQVEIQQLVAATNQNSLQLCEAIREGNGGLAIQLVGELLAQNEPALRIVATLIGQFRMWTIIKVMIEAGERDDQAIAKLADLKNPKRLYFLKKEISRLRGQQLLKTLPILLELEAGLKQGAIAEEILPTKILELCQHFR